ncbi:MAG: hypothetical protein PHU25_22035 [Deltaproteobacteria bacterium]|nr:hypothetical protein [Deltaproteobacteria bacterium]
MPKKRLPLVAALLGAVALGSCTGHDLSPQGSPSQRDVSRGIITASLERYIESGSDEPYEQFGITGVFVRHASEEGPTADALLGSRVPETDLSLDTCSLPAPVLDGRGADALEGGTAIELLDVGDLSVSIGEMKKPVPTRTFPDLLKVIVGVIYAADETQDIVYRPGETYSVRGTGSDSVAPFEVVLEAPDDMADLKIDGLAPGEQTPFVQRGKSLELTWEPGGYGDEAMITLTWTGMGAPWSLACRARDDGIFVVPAEITAALPDHLTATDESMTVSRVRQVAFRADGISSSAFSFVISTNFPVKF